MSTISIFLDFSVFWLTKDSPLGVHGISDRDLSQSIDHMGLVIWNFYRFSKTPLSPNIFEIKLLIFLHIQINQSLNYMVFDAVVER